VCFGFVCFDMVCSGGRGEARWVTAGSVGAWRSGFGMFFYVTVWSDVVSLGGQLTAMRGDRYGWFSKERASKNY